MATLNRREVLHLGAGTILASSWCGTAQAANATDIPVPSSAQRTWQDCEVGLIYHFDLPVAAGVFASNNTHRRSLDPNLYQPSKLDTDQWVEAAKAAGARYAIFTATHFHGFMQWQSDLYPFGLKQTTWRDGKGDVVRDFVASCRAAGIRPGIYFSTHRNVYWNVWGHYVDQGEGRGTQRQQEFNRIAEGMTEELCSRYGDLVQIWYDAGVKTPAEGGPDVLPIFERHQKDSVFYHSLQRSDHRWIGNESGHAGYPCWARMPRLDGVSHNHPAWRKLLHSGDVDGDYWSPGMVDVPLRGHGAHNWFWAPGQDEKVFPLEQLMKMYYQSVGHNCNLILGEVISPDGLVPESDIERLAEFGREVTRRFGSPIAATTGSGTTVELALDKPTRIDHIEIMEQIDRGERIRAYQCEGMIGADRWQTLCAGTSVGHKRLEQFDSIEVARVRLRVTQSVADPAIRRLAVYSME